MVTHFLLHRNNLYGFPFHNPFKAITLKEISYLETCKDLRNDKLKPDVLGMDSSVNSD